MTPEVIENRLQRARIRMGVAGLDGLIATDKYNYWYLTGHLSGELEKRMRPMVFILPKEGDPALVIYQQQAKKALQTCPAAKVFGYEDIPCPDELFVDALKALGLEKARVGMEFGGYQRLGISYDQLQAIRKALPAMNMADAGQIFQELRVIKDPYEIEAIQKACDLSLVAWEKAVPQFREGMKAGEIASTVAAELIRAGSDFNIPGHVTVEISSGGDLQYGKTVWCDFGGTLHGYQADMARRAILGKPTPAQTRYHRQAFELLNFLIKSIRPGIKASDVAVALSDRMVQMGFPALGLKKRAGHGLGLAAAEIPSLGRLDATVLKPGMILTPEPRFNLPDGRVHIEEVVVVTESGCRQLTTGAEILYVAGR